MLSKLNGWQRIVAAFIVSWVGFWSVIGVVSFISEDSIDIDLLISLGTITLVPVILVLVLYFAINWIIAGFQKSDISDEKHTLDIEIIKKYSRYVLFICIISLIGYVGYSKHVEKQQQRLEKQQLEKEEEIRQQKKRMATGIYIHYYSQSRQKNITKKIVLGMKYYDIRLLFPELGSLKDSEITQKNYWPCYKKVLWVSKKSNEGAFLWIDEIHKKLIGIDLFRASNRTRFNSVNVWYKLELLQKHYWNIEGLSNNLQSNVGLGSRKSLVRTIFGKPLEDSNELEDKYPRHKVYYEEQDGVLFVEHVTLFRL